MLAASRDEITPILLSYAFINMLTSDPVIG